MRTHLFGSTLFLLATLTATVRAEEASVTESVSEPVAPVAGPALEGSADALTPAALAAPVSRIVPRLTPGSRWLRTLTFSSTVDAAVTRGEAESSTRWAETYEVEVEMTLIAGSRRGPRNYDLLFRRVEQLGAPASARLPGLPAAGDHWRCEGDESWVCTGVKGTVTPPFWLLPEWSAWWFEGRLGDDGAYTRVRGVARQLGLPPSSRVRLTLRTAGSSAAGLTELDLSPSGAVPIAVGDCTESATLSGSGHLSADLALGIVPQLSLQWRAEGSGRLPGGQGLFRRSEGATLNWTEKVLAEEP